ncbi:MAG TPA: thioesterase family protein [Ornithinimicrobium sp.]|uniref:acyl-CoA thioesterase n=1 Tax=Ornithinimicrobium sp. TaxID=1977084 RepID=UPI002B49FB4D|nr:thioesterase family protein [Ornithinimicrobium sp.]HKJ12786.1 thioesterase family protein [Ornithinimicrobium sp.]
MPSPAESRFAVDIQIRWSDMDVYGHVNNVQFLRLLEDARVYAFRHWFGSERSLLREGVLVARQEIDYLAPLTFNHEPARIEVWPCRLSGASFDIGYAVKQVGSEVTFALAEATLVAYDFSTGSPRRLEDAQREALRADLDDPPSLRSHRGRR